MHRQGLILRIALLCLAVAGVARSEQRVDFDRDVRPIFNQHCISCHGGVKQAGDMSFVYADRVRSVIEPGDADASYLIERVTAEHDLERMPPPEHGRALNEEELSVLRRWIDEGASWSVHWAFAPPRTSQLPVDPEDSWSRSRVDRLILARLSAAGLEPAREAPPDRWLRRASLDLVGLPPAPEERGRFLSDLQLRGEDAYGAAVDRLLGSPAFGERWASVWLDALRYADSRGLGQDGRRTVWKYRDWVVRAFNADLPYDQFSIRQLAGDLLPSPSIDDLVATACSRLTQTNEEGGTDDEMFRVEAVIDRVNTLWQTWQGLSFGCAQCHSHPYEPIRHDEYYRFLSFFNNTVDCDLTSDLPAIQVPLDDAQITEAEALDREIKALWHTEWRLGYELLGEASNWHALSGLAAWTNNATRVVVAKTDGVEEYRTSGTVAKETTVTLEAPLPPSLGRLTALRFTGLPENEAIARADSEWGFVLSHIEARLILADGSETPLELVFVIADEPDPILDPQLSLNRRSNRGFGAYSRIHYPRSAAFVLASPVEVGRGDRIRISLSQDVFELGAFPLVAHRGRLAVSGNDAFTRWWTDKERVASRSRLRAFKEKRRAIPAVGIPIMAERPARLSRPSFVFDRGNYLSKLDAVTAGTPNFLPPLSPSEGRPPNRLDLARWIASPDNPLTARVAVNRVWGQLFGIGLVETQEDFGTSGARPSHPMLLDDLAARFKTEMRWSLKALLRELVLTSTYRQASRTTPEKLVTDPRNRLLSRGPRRRLPAETIRDQALAVAGLLSLKPFGPPVHPPIPDEVWKPFQAGDKWNTPGKNDPDRYRRTVYTYTKRTIPYPVLASFDAPSREFCSVRRLPSNTPLQALTTLNDATFVEAALGLARRMQDVDGHLTEQLRFGFLLAVCREPTAAEIKELERLCHRASPDGTADSLAAVASVLLNLDEVLTK